MLCTSFFPYTAFQAVSTRVCRDHFTVLHILPGLWVNMDAEWLREGLRLSLKASIYTVAHTGNDQPPERDPRLRKLIERILFSRKLILTYHVVILCFVLVLSIIHWTSLLIRWKRKSASRLFAEDAYDGDAESIQPASKPDNDQGMKGIYSSGSSSKISGDDYSLGKIDENEETPLLRPSLKRLPQNIMCRIRALLMYQPRPIPIVNRLLPSNGTSMIVISFLVLNLFYIFYDIHLVYYDFIVLADRFGLVFSANIPLLYLLAAKNQPMKLLTGRSYESMNVFHRRLGELLCLQGFLHALGFLLVWYALFKPAGLGLVRFLLLKRNLIGTGMLLAYELLYFTSFSSFRQRWYELFLGLHVVFQILALLGLYFHHATGRPYALAALVIFILDRIVYRTRLKSITISAQTQILEDEETVKLTSVIVLQPRQSFLGLLNRSIGSGWQAADHIFITVPSLSRKHILQAHPFTIASAPPQLGASEAHLELLIRAQDGFSRDLLNAARLHKELQIRIDGPYGSSHARTMLEDSDLALLVAGGSGIAVSWPLIQHLLAKSCSSDMERATTNSPCRQKIVLIWVVHETAHLSWLGREALAAAEDLGAEIIIPRATEEIGRPDLKGMVRNIVDLYAGKGKTSVVASGPDGMGRLVRNTCAEQVWEGRDVKVAIEKFGW
ncbi:ferric reductase transmembrane component [Diplocarpon rosae]|nr:ferric reductase transmembrane component [Diplocarpon rosae]